MSVQDVINEERFHYLRGISGSFVKLIFNYYSCFIMLVLHVQQSESVVRMCIYPLFCARLFHIGH